MKIYEFYFSPTGGTKKAADILAGGLQGDIVPVNLTDYRTQLQNFTLNREDIAIVAVPSYGGRVPAIAVERLSMLNGHNIRTVLVCVYGNRAYEDTLLELEDTAKQAGFHVIAAGAAIAEHSIARQFASGRPDMKDEKQLSDFAEQIQNKLSAGNMSTPEIPGNRPYRKAGGTGMIPKPMKGCTDCKVCAKECPVQAIDYENTKKVNEKKCISCMRCISVCPHSVRRLNPVMLSVAGIALKKVCSERKECELFI